MTPLLSIRGVRSVAVEVPMAIPLGTSAQRIDRATLLLIDLDTHEGVTGRAMAPETYVLGKRYTAAANVTPLGMPIMIRDRAG